MTWCARSHAVKSKKYHRGFCTSDCMLIEAATVLGPTSQFLLDNVWVQQRYRGRAVVSKAAREDKLRDPDPSSPWGMSPHFIRPDDDLFLDVPRRGAPNHGRL